MGRRGDEIEDLGRRNQIFNQIKNSTAQKNKYQKQVSLLISFKKNGKSSIIVNFETRQ